MTSMMGRRSAQPTEAANAARRKCGESQAGGAGARRLRANGS